MCALSVVDDGREITVPVLLDGEESIMEFIDLPYSGVSRITSILRPSLVQRNFAIT